MTKSCQSCGTEKNSAYKEASPFYEQDGLIDNPIDPLSVIDCQSSSIWRQATVCHNCFHKLDVDMWISEDCWRKIDPKIPFHQLPPMLKLPGHVHVAPDSEQLFEDLGSALLGNAQRSVQERGVFHMALSGGGTPEPFYIRMVTDPKFRAFPWEQTHLWIVDERCVPEDHEKSNIKMIREAMTEHVPIKRSHVHPMPVMADDPAKVYEEELSNAFDGLKLSGVPRIDFILLGMGGDAHTASLFPDSPALSITDRWIATNDGERVVPPPRVTMTYPLINHGREVVVLLVGSGKHATLKQIETQLAKDGPDIKELPITGIDPSPNDGELIWYLDTGAATGQ